MNLFIFMQMIFFFYQLQFSWFRGCSRIRGSWKARELISGEVVLLCLAILDWNYRKEKKVCTLFCPSPWKREVAMSGHCHLLGNSSIAEVWMGLGILIRNHKEVFPYLTSETDPALTSSSNLSWHWNKVLNLFFFLNCPVACRILVPQPRIQTLTPAAEAQSFNHWTTKEVLSHVFFICKYKHLNYQLSVVIEIRDTKILK